MQPVRKRAAQLRSAAFRPIHIFRQSHNNFPNLVLVSDYIYSDAIRYDETTETYRRLLASIDRKLAAVSDVVLELSAGNRIVHKGEGLL